MYMYILYIYIQMFFYIYVHARMNCGKVKNSEKLKKGIANLIFQSDLCVTLFANNLPSISTKSQR